MDHADTSFTIFYLFFIPSLVWMFIHTYSFGYRIESVLSVVQWTFSVCRIRTHLILQDRKIDRQPNDMRWKICTPHTAYNIWKISMFIFLLPFATRSYVVIRSIFVSFFFVYFSLPFSLLFCLCCSLFFFLLGAVAIWEEFFPWESIQTFQRFHIKYL